MAPGSHFDDRSLNVSSKLHCSTFPMPSKLRCSTSSVSTSKLQCSTLPTCEQVKVDDDLLTHLDSSGQAMEGRLSLLLLLSARCDDTTAIHHLLEQAAAAGVRPSAYTMEQVLNTHVRRKNIAAAVSLYGSIKREYPEAVVDSCTMLHLCILLLETERCLEAVQILREFVEAGKGQEAASKNAAESCKALLTKAAETGSYELAKEMFDLLLQRQLVDPGPQVVAPLLQSKLDRNDLPGTVGVAEYVYHTFNTLPKRMEIFIRLMQHNPPTEDDLLPVLRAGQHTRQDTDLLGRMFDLAQSCYGATQAQHDLLFAALESGHPKAAQIVLQTLADDVDDRQIVRMCKLYAKNERESALEHLLAASKGMTTISRLKIYEALLDAYKLSNNKAGEKAVSLWTSLQEEGLTPSSTFLNALTTLLDQHDIKPPFHTE